MATAQLQQVLDGFEARLAVVEKSLSIAPGGSSTGKAPSAAGGSAAAAVEDAPFVSAYDSYCTTKLDPFVSVSDKLGGGAAKSAAIVKKAWAAQRDFLVMASKCKKPDQAALMEKLKPVQQAMKDANAAISRDDWEMHGKTVFEGMSCLNWVAVAPPAGLPKDIVESAVGGSDYWANKIRVLYKKTGPPEQVEFCDTFKALLLGLKEYVLEYHKTGVDWNMRGGDAASYSGASGSGAPAAAPVSSGAPVPPGPPPPAVAAAKPSAGGAGLGAVFGELSKGLDVTKGLKKVTKDQQTWRAEYKGGDAAATPPQATSKAVTAAPPKALNGGGKALGPPKLEFLAAANKWSVENHGKDGGVVTVEVSDSKHSVYIYGCSEATIDVKGKCKSVCIDGCKKTKVLVDDCISSVELVNCQRMQVQIRGVVPSVAIDKTDGFLCYLSASSLETTFTSSKSSEMNVSFPKPGSADDELMELPIPEQFVHSLTSLEAGGAPRITSNVSDLYTH